MPIDKAATLIGVTFFKDGNFGRHTVKADNLAVAKLAAHTLSRRSSKEGSNDRSWLKADETDHPPERRLYPRVRKSIGGGLSRPEKADTGRPLAPQKRTVSTGSIEDRK